MRVEGQLLHNTAVLKPSLKHASGCSAVYLRRGEATLHLHSDSRGKGKGLSNQLMLAVPAGRLPCTRRYSRHIGSGLLEQIGVSWNEWNFFLRSEAREPECVPGGSRVGGPSRDVHIQGYHSTHLLSHRPSLEQT